MAIEGACGCGGIVARLAKELLREYPTVYAEPGKLLGSPADTIRGADWNLAERKIRGLTSADIGNVIGCCCLVEISSSMRIRPRLFELHYYAGWDTKQYMKNREILIELGTTALLAYVVYAYSQG